MLENRRSMRKEILLAQMINLTRALGRTAGSGTKIGGARAAQEIKHLR
jgi:hypothetical protein